MAANCAPNKLDPQNIAVRGNPVRNGQHFLIVLGVGQIAFQFQYVLRELIGITVQGSA